MNIVFFKFKTEMPKMLFAAALLMLSIGLSSETAHAALCGCGSIVAPTSLAQCHVSCGNFATSNSGTYTKPGSLLSVDLAS